MQYSRNQLSDMLKEHAFWVLARDGTPSPVNFNHADLSGADLGNCSLVCMQFIGADLTGASLRGANLNGTVFKRINGYCADFTKTQLKSTHFHLANLEGADFTDALIVGSTEFDHCNIIGAKFDLNAGVFRNCVTQMPVVNAGVKICTCDIKQLLSIGHDKNCVNYK